jgi:crotonobetainyl-CoA:carnitine CoA-transferase CaiB-like acyl-CoA transferase
MANFMTNASQQASQQALPLTGIRVVDYSHFLAGPYVGRCRPHWGPR